MKKINSLILLNLFMLLTIPAFADLQNLSVNAAADVAGILELKIEESGQSELRFGNIRPSSTEAIEVGPIIVKIHITSNIGDVYRVTQSMNNVLENAAGDKINCENLKFKTTAAKTAGTVVATPTAASKTAQTIFISDSKGTSDTIHAEYILTVPASQAPGDYSTLLTYTVSS